MALSHELPIYRDIMKLLSLTIEKTKCYPRFYRYTVGEKMVNINLDIEQIEMMKISMMIELLIKYNNDA
ncbi:four helix bundle protein [Segatella paludivivens]|uniref:hypothetical protein n=1 Tax=Segatella paludivivens TaxID=185294 RepID=UPI00037716AC|nr:hypothetical protein [Segatella paludivivens]